jgi:translation initiation factor IF-3
MKKKNNNFPNANLEITASPVRVVDENGEMLGVMSRDAALERAQRIGLDLVEIAPNSEPPVCKIMDFGKYKYQEKKKINDNKKKQKVVTLKEIKLRPTISDHDLGIKIRSINQFIAGGDKVKISLKFKGREITHQEIGHSVFDKIKNQLSEECKIELEPKMEGNQLLMIVVPK